MMLVSCAVGPDFANPAAPEISRYTREPLAVRTASSNTPNGTAQRFYQGRDIPLEWWKLFRSRPLNAVIAQALKNNPNLQSALAALRAAKETVAAQKGKFFPLVQANFNPTRNRTSAALSPVPASGTNIYDLDTAQVLVSYTFDVWGLNRRTVEIASGAGGHPAFSGRSRLPRVDGEYNGRSHYRSVVARSNRGNPSTRRHQ